MIEERTLRRSRDQWLERLEGLGIPAGPINTVPEALADPQAVAREMVVELEHPRAGRIRALGPVVKLSGTPATIRRPPRASASTRRRCSARWASTQSASRPCAPKGPCSERARDLRARWSRRHAHARHPPLNIITADVRDEFLIAWSGSAGPTPRCAR